MAGWQLVLPRGRKLVLGDRTRIAGILNCTPDSFSDGGAYSGADDAARAGLAMLSEGADLIDVGGESTRPGSSAVEPRVQLERILPVIRGLRERTDAPISVDTRSAEVAGAALEAGADIVNDVSACSDPGMAAVLRRHEVPVILMHMQGTPLDMQVNPEYPGGVVATVFQFFQERLGRLSEWGIDSSRAILDPGIGFGKRVQHNLELIRNIEVFHSLGRPILIGASRKGFLDKVIARDGARGDFVGDRDLSTLIVNAIALSRGADLLRVHNVRYASALVNAFAAVSGAASGVAGDLKAP